MLEREPASVNPKRRGLPLLLLAAAAAQGAPAAACHLLERELIVEYELIAPLVAHLGPVMALRIDRAGCAEVRRFALASRPGVVRSRLDKAEFSALAAALAAIPEDFDPRAAKLALREFDRGRAMGFAVIDAPVRRFRLAPQDRAALSFTWNDLEQDLLNHGEEPEPRLVATWRDRLEAIARRIDGEDER